MRYVFLAALVFAAACKDSPAPPATPDPNIGDYPLRTINGNPPPQIVDEDTTGTYEILYGIVKLNANKSFVDSTELRYVPKTGSPETWSEVARGTWHVKNDSLFLSPTDADTYAMDIEFTGQLVQDFFGILLVYRR